MPTLLGSRTATTTGGTDITCDVQDDVAIEAGDLLIFKYGHSESEDNVATASWSDGDFLGGELQAAGSSTPPSVPGMQWFYEWLEGGEEGETRQVTGTFSSQIVGIIEVWRGVDLDNPMDVAIVTAAGASDGEPDPPQITPTTDGCTINVCGLKDITTAETLTSNPSGYTGTGFANVSDSVSCSIAGAYLDQVTAQAENPGAFDFSQGDDQWCAATAALRPAVSVTAEATHARVRNDDGDEDEATWAAAEDTGATAVSETNFRTRHQLAFDGNPGSVQVSCRYRMVGDPDSEWRAPEHLFQLPDGVLAIRTGTFADNASGVSTSVNVPVGATGAALFIQNDRGSFDIGFTSDPSLGGVDTGEVLEHFAPAGGNLQQFRCAWDSTDFGTIGDGDQTLAWTYDSNNNDGGAWVLVIFGNSVNAQNETEEAGGTSGQPTFDVTPVELPCHILVGWASDNADVFVSTDMQILAQVQGPSASPTITLAVGYRFETSGGPFSCDVASGCTGNWIATAITVDDDG